MSTQLRLPRFWILAAAQVVLAIAAAATWFYFRTKAYLAGPPDPDTYAWSWDFQWMVFCIYWLPALLLCIGILLAIERTTLIPYYQAASRRALQRQGHGP
jgi:ABC-type dipeptide/oligopeptide/nickel transport system permease component